MHGGGEGIKLHIVFMFVSIHSDASALFTAFILCDGHHRDPPEYLSLFVAILDHSLARGYLSIPDSFLSALYIFVSDWYTQSLGGGIHFDRFFHHCHTRAGTPVDSQLAACKHTMCWSFHCGHILHPKDTGCWYEKKEGARKKIAESDFFDGLFLRSCILRGKFTSIFVNWQVVSIDLHVCFGVLQLLWPSSCWYISVVNLKFLWPPLNTKCYHVLWYRPCMHDTLHTLGFTQAPTN